MIHLNALLIYKKKIKSNQLFINSTHGTISPQKLLLREIETLQESHDFAKSLELNIIDYF